jgi:chromosome segregation ATPase
MDQPDHEGRIHELESHVGTLDDRVTTHGRQIDQMHEVLTRMSVRADLREEKLTEISDSISRLDGKVDAQRQDLLAQTQGKAAALWDKAVWAVVYLLIGFALRAVLDALTRPM